MLINDIINEVQDDGKPRKIRGQELNDEVAQELDDEIDLLDLGYLSSQTYLLHNSNDC